MKRFLPLVLVIAVAVFLVSSLFKPGFMDSHDSLWHVERFMNMKEMLLAGQFPVRWSAALDHDYGLPLFNFTYPLPYYIGGSLMLTGLGPVKIYNLLLLISYLAGGIGFYFLGKGGWKGFCAALIYLLSPYLFLDIFVRGALGEIMAMGLFPWTLLAFRQIEKKGKVRWYTPIPLALLFLSHNFYGLLFAALLIFLVIVSYKNKKQIFLSLLLSFGLAAFFLIPALGEKSYLAKPVNGFNYLHHFVYPIQLLYSKWSYLGSFPGLYPDEMSFQLGLANWVIVGFSLIVLISRKLHPKIIWYLIPLLVSLLLTLPVSNFIWQPIPLLQTIQFPWRFIGIATSILPLLHLELTSLANNKNKSKLLQIGTALLLILAFYNIRNYRRPFEWLNQEQFLALHYLYADGTTTAHREELVPKWAAAERFIPAPPSHVIGQSSAISNIVLEPLKITFTATTENNEATAIIYRNYFPSWQGRVDDKTLSLEPTSTGEIKMSLTPGEHQYEIFVAETPLEQFSDFVTLITLAGIIYLWRRNG